MYAYYLRQPWFEGNTAYPLNDLRGRFPDLYRRNREWYRGRVQVMQRSVPLLDANWPDCVHLSTMHPNFAHRALEVLNDPAASMARHFFKVPIVALDLDRTVLWDWHHSYRGDPDPSEFKTIPSWQYYRETRALPTHTYQYYEDEIEEGRIPLIFVGVPALLHKGPISMARMEIVDWREPPDRTVSQLPNLPNRDVVDVTVAAAKPSEGSGFDASPEASFA